jgi:hypothetical protein
MNRLRFPPCLEIDFDPCLGLWWEAKDAGRVRVHQCHELIPRQVAFPHGIQEQAQGGLESRESRWWIPIVLFSQRMWGVIGSNAVDNPKA